MTKMKLSIIIPVYNEEKTISVILDKVKNLTINGIEKEIIIVDDGSTDNSKNILKSHVSKEMIIICHKKNSGKGAAVKTGIKNATGDFIVIQDADLEYDPNYLISLLVPIQNATAKVVYGTRLKKMPKFAVNKNMPLFILHFYGNRFLSLVTSVLYGQWLTDMETCYKIFPRDAVKNMILRARGFEFEPEITAKLLKKGYKIVEIPIETIPRGHDEGKKLNTVKDGFTAFWTLFKYRHHD